MYKLESFGITHIGLSRSNNEDVWATLPEQHFFVLADGMGGHKAGEVAAFMAMQSMCEWVTSHPNRLQLEDSCLLLQEGVAQTNAKVFQQSHQDLKYAGMGTTLSCFLIIQEYLIYAHVGDSRLYRYRGKLEQLTVDHSLCRSSETLSPPQRRHVITRAIGTHSTLLPDIGVIPLRPKDIYMLCSDGLSDYVEESKMALLLSSPLALKEIGTKLVAAALKKGGNDNITLLLVKVT